MSDSLRTKIIESLTGKTIVVSDGYDGYSIIERDAAEVLADAVIRELAIEVEDGECGYCQAQLPGCRYSSWANE